MKKARFRKSVIEAAKASDLQLPWARGANRAAFVVLRKKALNQRKSA